MRSIFKRHISFVQSLLIFAVLPLAVLAQAAQLDVADKTVYRNGFEGPSSRHDVWKMAPDGTFEGKATRVRSAALGDTFVEHIVVEGKWRVEENVLCVKGENLEKSREICLELKKISETNIRTGYDGEDTRSGRDWEVYISKD